MPVTKPDRGPMPRDNVRVEGAGARELAGHLRDAVRHDERRRTSDTAITSGIAGPANPATSWGLK